MAEDTEYLKLPILQQCSHKLWKARVHGYTEAAKIFQEEEENSPVFGQYLGLVSKFVSDSHAAAQEKGLEATLHFIENASIAGKTVKDVMSAIVAKSIAAQKKSAQDLSVQIPLMYIEIEKQESAVEELVKGLDHKNPKIVAACLSTLTTCLKTFGSQVVGVKPLMKPIQNLIEDRDKTVRNETKALVVEIYRWIGEAIKPQLTKLKPIQLTELEAEFAKVRGEKAGPLRYLRSQRPKERTASVSSPDGVPEEVALVEEIEVDPLSLVEPLNVLEKIPPDFYAQIEAKKWQDRKLAFEKLDEVLNYPKFDKGEHGDLVRAILKIITKDSNVVVVGLATKCIARLASGLQNNYQPYASVTLPQLLMKFKEKKAVVVSPLREAVDAIFLSTNLENIMGDVIECLDNKNPVIKAETASFLGRCFTKSTSSSLSKKLLKPYVTALLKTLNESDVNVRDNSAETLGIAMKVVGEKTMLPFLSDVDAIKLAKIKECCEKAVVKVVFKTPPPPVKPKQQKKVNKPVKQIVETVDEEPVVEVKKTNQRIDISTHITEQFLKELGDKDWKVRSEALSKLQTLLTDTKIKSSLGELPSILMQRFVDCNAKLIVTALEVCSALAVALGPGSKNYVRSFARAIFQTLGDSKQLVRSAAMTCLNSWANEAGAKEFFYGEIIPEVLKSGQTTLKIELWAWLSEILPKEIGLPTEDLNLIVPSLFLALEDRNADVRKAANNAVLGVMIHVGYCNMAQVAEKLKPSSKVVITQILEKVRPDVPELPVQPKIEVKGKMGPPKSAPIKKVRASTANSTKPVIRKKEEEIDTTPLLLINKMKHQRVLDEQKLKIIKWSFTTPRSEFVDLLRDQMTVAGFNKALISHMFHTDFKFHIKSIELLMNDLCNEEALVANFDLILKWLTLRFFDTNPSVLLKGLDYLRSALNILININYTMFDVEANSFIPYLVMKIGDQKDTVRDKVRAMLKQFALLFAPSKLFLHVMDGLKSKNSRLRAECLDELGNLIEQFGTSVCLPSSAVALKEISKQIADRDNSVRSAALNAIVKAFYVDGDKIYKQIGRLSDKDMSYLEERIKRTSQNRTKLMHDTIRISADETIRVKPRDTTIIEECLESAKELEKEPVIEKVASPLSDPPLQEYPIPPSLEALLKPLPVFTVPQYIPNLDLIEIDDSFLNDPIYIPEGIYERMKNKVPCCPLIDELFQNMANDNIEVAVENLKKVHEVIRSESFHLLEPFSYRIFDSLISQFSMANSYSSEEPKLGLLYKILLQLLRKIFADKNPIGKNADEIQLKNMLNLLLIALIEEKTKLFDGKNLNSSISNLVTDIIENADTTNVTCAMINSISELIGNADINPKLIDLNVRFIMKIVSLTKKSTNIDAMVNLDQILLSCHNFMKEYPRNTWLNYSTDKPMKAIATLIVDIVKKKGLEIVRHYTKIEDVKSSELVQYIKKILKSMTNEPNLSDSSLPVPTDSNLLAQYYFNRLRMHQKRLGYPQSTEESLDRDYLNIDVNGCA